MTKRQLVYGLAGVLGFALAGEAQATGTIAGTAVNNTATIDYVVGGVNQPDVNSNTASFVVDRRVNLTVAEAGGASTAVAPGSSSQVTTYTVTNTTNSVMDFRLTAAQDANGATTAFSDTDNFDVDNVRVYVDDGDDVWEPLQDTATYIDELAADDNVTVFVVVDIPVGRSDADTAGVTLTAHSATAGTASSLGADMVETTVADTPGSVDTVFGDTAGDTDANRDGKFSDDDEYDVASATITLVKTSIVVSDPFNGTTLPKAIPLAVMEYCIAVTNSGSVAADTVAITDSIPANSTYATGTIFAGGTVTTGVCDTAGAGGGVAEDDNATGADESDPRGGNFNAGVVSVSLPSVAAGATVTTRFRVTVD